METMGHKTHFKLEKFRTQDWVQGLAPYKVEEWDGNLGLNEGLNLAANLICGAGGTAFNNANSYIGVGDSSTAAAASQTGLQAATNKLYKAMESSFPTSGTSQQIVFKSSFGSAEANFAWNEYSVSNSNSDSGTNLLRGVSAKGTKQSGETWTLTITLTLS